ncbi:GTP cyclohydrolase III [Halobaculum halobium]|uniref:GTP cyclohydrolase III n=1 Tax=Halobaculum halobium TaxID=3032281 RepID=A0ABD5T8S0_9EURY|nr:GTP cyclohydrolase III [Halobaculum sp. SYNS20]
MTAAQLTLVQIDNYGPWTVTPEPRREMDLQTLQSRLFADMAQYIGNRGGYVFFTRFDNMVAVTNGLDRRDHELLQESVGNRFPVTVSLGVGVDGVPIDALETATERVQAAGSAQSSDRSEALAGEFRDPEGADDGDVHIAHFDVNDATGKYTDRLNEFDSFINIEHGYASLMKYMREEHGALSFFVGGDNVIAVCPDLTYDEYMGAIDHVADDVDVQLKVGVGSGESPHEAGYAAKHALEDCRYEGTLVEFA